MKPIILLKLEGGLGNQLFQYFFARKLCDEISARLFIDVTYFFHSYTKKHEKPHLLQYSEIRSNHSVWKSFPRLTREIWKLLEILGQRRYVRFLDDKHSDLGDAKVAFIKGYFHNFRYLPRSEDIVKFFSSLEIPAKEQIVIDKVSNRANLQSKVLLHVRRGDYVEQSHIYDVLSANYYSEAIRYLAQINDANNLILMSDEIKKARDFLKFEMNEISIFDEDEELNPNETLEVASHSNSIVIANSTFSWWIAYLGTLRGTTKYVVYPVEFNKANALDVRLSLGINGWIPFDGSGKPSVHRIRDE